MCYNTIKEIKKNEGDITMKNITNMEQAINYARQENLTISVTDMYEDYYLVENCCGTGWYVVGEMGWCNTLEEVLAMEFVYCELMEEEEELLIFVENTGW